MPIFFQKELSAGTRLGIWKIEEEEAFFLQAVPLQRTITHRHKRLQHLAGRYLLKTLAPLFPIELIEIADTKKPFLADEAYHFSISHCGDYAAAIVSPTERVGIDIEIPGPKVELIAHKFLHGEEALRIWSHYKPEELQEALTAFWSGKEALFKWWGLGKVDFSEMLLIHDVFPPEAGAVRAEIVLPERALPLTVHYQPFDKLVLAWVHSAP